MSTAIRNRKEIQTIGNLEIAKMLGWYQVEGHKDAWFLKDDTAEYVVYQQYKDQYNELPFHKDWNWLQKAKEQVVMLTNKKISDVTREHLGKLAYEVNVATLSFVGWDWTNYQAEEDTTPIELMFSVVAELSELYNKEQEVDE